jgi:hypothetical protein
MVMLMHGAELVSELVSGVGGQSPTCAASFHTNKNKHVVKKAPFWVPPLL